MPPPQPPPQTIRGVGAGSSVFIQIPAHDPAQGSLSAVSTQVDVDLRYTYTIDNPSSLPASLGLCAPNSFQAVEILSPSGAQMGFAVFALTPIAMNVGANTIDGPHSVTYAGLVHMWQSVQGGPFPEFEGPAGSTVQLEIRFPNLLNTQQSGGCAVRQQAEVSATVSVHYS